MGEKKVQVRAHYIGVGGDDGLTLVEISGHVPIIHLEREVRHVLWHEHGEAPGTIGRVEYVPRGADPSPFD